MAANIAQRAGGRVDFSFAPEDEFVIGEVARFTGYDRRTLQKLDGSTLPASHRDEHGRRVWYAKDLVAIRAQRVHALGKRCGRAHVRRL